MDIFFTPAYAELYADEDSQPEVIDFSCEHGNVYYSFLKRRIHNINELYYDITTPYGYGGPIITECYTNETELVKAFEIKLSRYCHDNNIVSEFIRFHPLTDNHRIFNGVYKPELYSMNIAVDLRPRMEDIWSGFEHKVRKNVNKASRFALVTAFDGKGERLDEFLKIYYETMDRRNAGELYYFERSFFEGILRTLSGHYCFVLIGYEGKAISTELILLGDSGIMHSFLGGTSREYYDLRPNDLLKYRAIEWGKERGYHTYLLGGGPSPQDGVYKYKRSFAPNGVHEFYLGKKIWNREVYDKLSVHNKAPEDSSYFPLYRAK